MELPFIKMAATEIVSGVSGESEEKIRDVFDQAIVSNVDGILATRFIVVFYFIRCFVWTAVEKFDRVPGRYVVMFYVLV